ncbi:MAG: hypothetical protein QOH99_193 [Frankiaceae bacterium]|nr:hypothetical protein [Frankiaceae bacterium]
MRPGMADADIEDVRDVTEPEDLEHHIERTRDDLAITIDAIADRVSPKRVASRGVATAKGAAHNAMDAARTAMIAAQQKVADLRDQRGWSANEAPDKLPTLEPTSYTVERRQPNPKAIVAGVAAAGLVVALLLRRRSGRR